MSLQCGTCCREFSVKSNLTRHLRMVHNEEVERIDIQPAEFEVYHYKCLEGCDISFKYNRELRKHLRCKHNIDLVELNLEFPNPEEFNKWLYDEETNNYVQYIHLTATKRKSTGVETYYYECSRTGKRSYVDETVRKRKARKWLSKLNRGCTSQIIVNKSHDGSHSVTYFKTHYGHELTLEQVKLSKYDRGAIASKLLLGVPISTVLHSVKNPSGSLKRINLLGRKDVCNIRKAFNIDVREGQLVNADTININFFITECEQQQYNPILYFNVEDNPSDEICFVLMTKYQSEVLKEVGSNIVVISSMSLKCCNFTLITLFVVSKSWESFPAACMFTNKSDYVVYEVFFNKIQQEVGNVVPAIIITNCNDMYYEAWKNVMGDADCNIYNPFQIETDFRLNLNRIVCSEIDVTKVKRKWLYDAMKTLQNNPDEADFLESLEATLKVLRTDTDFNEFLTYFSKNFSNPNKWADCYRTGCNLPLQQLEVITDVLKQYLNEENESRFDKIFHSLIRFIRDETVNSMLKMKTNRTCFVSENDSRHHLLLDRHFNGVHLHEDLWNVTDEDLGTTYLVQKYLERKCCNLICSFCHICIHCFSCTCVDFFVSNAICVHIHYIWVTYFQSIVQDDSNDITEQSCDEEIIIQVDMEQEEEKKVDVTKCLRDEITEKTALLSTNICHVTSENTLKVILDTVNQLCELSADGNNEQVVVEDMTARGFLDDHSYL